MKHDAKPGELDFVGAYELLVSYWKRVDGGFTKTGNVTRWFCRVAYYEEDASLPGQAAACVERDSAKGDGETRYDKETTMTENETARFGETPDDAGATPTDFASGAEETGSFGSPRFNFETGSPGDADEIPASTIADSTVESARAASDEPDTACGAGEDEASAGDEAAANAAREEAKQPEANPLEPTQAKGLSADGDANGDTDAGINLQDTIENEAKGAMAGTGAKIGIAVAVVAALLVGLLVGAFVIKGGSQQAANSIAGKSKVTEQELESVVGSYTIDGKTENITVKEAIEQTGSPEAMKDESGNYAVPSADAVLSVARSKVLIADATAKGIQVTDEEVAAYAQQQLNSSDFESIGASYGMDAQSVVNLLRNTVIMNKLSESVMGSSASSAASLPNPPSEPQSSSSTASNSEEGDESEEAEGSERAESGSEAASSAGSSVSKEYADYIIALAGDEWDQAKGTWASTSGPYYQALSSYEITPAGASYEAAMAAYYVAYQAYSEEASATANVWTDYVNNLLNRATITIYTLSS